MRPHRRRSAVKAAVAAAAVIVALPHFPAGAQPADDTARYEELSAQAAQTEEDLSQAQDALVASQQEQNEANTALAGVTQTLNEALQVESQFRGEIDALGASMYRNGQIVSWSAIFTSGSAEEYLDQMSALDIISTYNAETLSRLTGVTSQADAARATAAQAQERATAAAAAAQTAVTDLEQKSTELDTQIQEVRDALAELSPEQRDEFGTVQDDGIYLGPPGAANDAMQAALGRRGSEYEWGATGPDEFDCSGLTSWAYRQAGVTIPRTSRQQWTVGRPVSQNELLPGDLLFYDDGTGNPATIHHVGMYVGDGRMVDAPSEGKLVDVRPTRSDGHYIGARRIVG